MRVRLGVGHEHCLGRARVRDRPRAERGSSLGAGRRHSLCGRGHGLGCAWPGAGAGVVWGERRRGLGRAWAWPGASGGAA